MSTDLFTVFWFIIFILVIFIAFIANIIIILAILRDKTMYTSTYFYIINVNIADLILVLSCLPERIAAIVYSNGGFHLGMYTCKLNEKNNEKKKKRHLFVFHDKFSSIVLNKRVIF